jgi:hypothetical protein
MIKGLQAYSKYRSARLSWLNNIPAHWDEKRAKFYFREIDKTFPDHYMVFMVYLAFILIGSKWQTIS